jgi:uncharacterized protein (TIGR00730 family)
MSKTRLPSISALCVFCGSSPGTDPRLRESAVRFGRQLAEAKVTLIFGGGHLGMMGATAEAALAGGGKVVGIIPEHLTHMEAAYREITELHIVESMHVRKKKMFDLAEAFVILPGGMGTMDETFEILTWKQLRLHNKPIIIVNQHGYWTPWLALVDHIVVQGYAHPDTKKLYTVVDDVDQVIAVAGQELARSVSGAPNLF